MADNTGFTQHDHRGCIANAMVALEGYCATRGLQLTPVRRRAFEILLSAHEAMGAYDVLARLADDGFGDKPPVAYRALAFLQKHGFVHRIERLNAFVACAHPGAAHDPAFMICRNCHRVAESRVDDSALSRSARASGFVIEQTMIEAEGLCPRCQP